MIILLIFAFFSGLVTLFAPCIWPLLPIILSSTTTGGHQKPLGITIGICLSFALFTLTISYIVTIIPFDPTILRYVAVAIIGFLGLSLVIPALGQVIEGAVSRLSSKVGSTKSQGTGFGSGLITGISLGIVWTPCAGPILATIATLAATRSVSFDIVLVTFVYVLGVGIPLFIFALLGQRLFTKSRLLNKYTGRIQQIFGIIMILTAVSILTNYDKFIQARLLDAFPSYSIFLNQLESNDRVKKELDSLKGKDTETAVPMRFPKANGLANYGPAPEFVGINQWLNSEGITMADLKGKVVLVDFWTYTCINCIRTLPHVTTWYNTYKDDGFVVIGVHTPEFEFEKNTNNVQSAIDQYEILYPVAQDNDFATWKAYDNHYWPAKYLIDAEGNIRYVHFGEGKYEETEEAIRTLLEEKGQAVKKTMTDVADTTPRFEQSPETYLGYARAERFASSEKLQFGPRTYTKPEVFDDNEFAFSGQWNVQEEYSESIEDGVLHMKFDGNKVFLVMHPTTANQKVHVFLDKKRVDESNQGTDVVDGTVTVSEPKLYELIDLKGKRGTYLLELKLDNGVQVFAFTFG